MDDATLNTRAAVKAPMVSRVDTGAITTLRLFRPTDAEIAAASASLSFPLGIEPLRLTDHLTPNARLGPGEWVLFGVGGDLAAKLDGILHDFAHVGHARARWRLNERGAELLQRGCSLDLDPAVFTVGACTRTLLSQVSVLILRPAAGLGIEVIGDSSLSDYLEAWLEDAAAGIE